MAMTIGEDVREINKIAMLLSSLGHSDNAEKLRKIGTRMVAQPPRMIPELGERIPRPGQEPIPLKHGGAMERLIQKFQDEQCRLIDRLIIDLGAAGMVRELGAAGMVPAYSAPKPAMPQLKRVRQY